MTSQLRTYPINRGIKNIGQVIEPDGKIYIIGSILYNTRLTPAVYCEPDTTGEALRSP